MEDRLKIFYKKKERFEIIMAKGSWNFTTFCTSSNYNIYHGKGFFIFLFENSFNILKHTDYLKETEIFFYLTSFHEICYINLLLFLPAKDFFPLKFQRCYISCNTLCNVKGLLLWVFFMLQVSFRKCLAYKKKIIY